MAEPRHLSIVFAFMLPRSVTYVILLLLICILRRLTGHFDVQDITIQLVPALHDMAIA
jgi:hypothetical protein